MDYEVEGKRYRAAELMPLPGSCKFLAMHLVDPNVRVLSTANGKWDFTSPLTTTGFF